MPKSAVRRVLPLIAVALLLAPAAVAQSLQRQIEQALRSVGLDRSDVGVVVLDADTGRELVAIRPDLPLIPASNMKLLTSGAAVTVLGGEYAFRTELLVDGDRLIIKGSGDPALADHELLKEMDLDVEDLLGVWVNAVKDSGARINEIVVDDRAFDRELFHETWPTDQLNRWYCAQVSGLNFHANVLCVYAEPSVPGAAPEIVVDPASPWIVVENRAESVREGGNTIWIARPNLSNEFTIRGNVRYPLGEPVEVALHDPARFVGDLLADRLVKAGMNRPSVRIAADEERLDDGAVVAVVRTPMDVVLRRCNVSSHNLYAEALIKRMGHEATGRPGSWSSGAAVIRMALQRRLGPSDAASVQIADGSGMSRGNRVSAGLLTRWLASFDPRDENDRAFIESLPRAGLEGTLRNRFRGMHPAHEIRAKTGYIRNVSSLSGYVSDAQTGERLVFSIIMNDFPAKVSLGTIRQTQDTIVQMIDDALSERTGRALGGD
ncbi:MAG: D-alanyl-D-alanine carboxypeptidase/D-alanyl-D-alanine endopeptidase [Phycisphaerales bacterium]